AYLLCYVYYLFYPFLYLLVHYIILLILLLKDPATTDFYTLSLHDALPISNIRELEGSLIRLLAYASLTGRELTLSLAQEVLKNRSEEHTSELQSRENFVCRLLLEKKT